ncbi:MAG: hypothetical protein FWD58_03575 [Firmicutes bacterium]|nr:hypothetical protein [Bacillota bacterium]
MNPNFEKNLSLYKIWAPDDSVWAQWAKPVLFANMAGSYERFSLEVNRFRAVGVGKISELYRDTAVILDFPSAFGITEAMELAGLGYRPVPLYNGVPAASGSTVKVNAIFSGAPAVSSVVNTFEIEKALFWGAEELRKLNIKRDAPPVFMLDSNRTKESAVYHKNHYAGEYDNRWCVFPQDFPSAKFLSAQGIKRIVLRSDRVRDDLSYVLHNYQTVGIKTYILFASETLSEQIIKKPSRFKRAFFRLLVTLKLKRNATGGFGGVIADMSEGGGHG